jgi:cell division protein FtsZ
MLVVQQPTHHPVHHPVQQPAQQALRTGTDNLPILNQVAQAGGNGQGGGGAVQPSDEGLNTPSVWRSARSQAAAKVDALSSNGMDEIEIPAFLRKQAD